MPDYLRLWETFGYNGVQYVIPGGNIVEMTALQAMRNPIVAACVKARQLVFSEIRFAWQRKTAGQFGQLFGSPALSILDKPWPQASTSDLLSWMEVDASFYGNSYWVKSAPDVLTRLDPSRVKILTADVEDDITGLGYGKKLVGYAVEDRKGAQVALFQPSEVVHYRPQPDPKHQFRGLSWLGSLLPDVIADSDLSDYKHAFINNAATPNLVIQFTEPIGKDAMAKFVSTMESSHTGNQMATKNLYVGAGVDVKTVGSNFADLAMQATQSHGETRIAAAAGVPPSLLGIAEGLKGSALNQGNFVATRRVFADITIRPCWRAACSALSTLVPPPSGARLWYDDRDVPFLQADLQDSANVRMADATTVLNLINSGYDPDSIIASIQTGDWSQLTHTGLISVQLQPLTYAQAAKTGALSLKPKPPPPPPPVMLPTPVAPAAPDDDNKDDSNA
jgi:phage portal protein BeeE